jgi:hypothetical protein
MAILGACMINARGNKRHLHSNLKFEMLFLSRFDSYGADCIYKADFMTHIKVDTLSFERFSHFLILNSFGS